MIIVKTLDPEGLLKAIKTGISKKEIVTWSYDIEGDFTHATDQWENKAWLRPFGIDLEKGEIRFKIINPREVKVDKATSAIYHGRFIEMLLSHFSSKIISAIAKPDKVVTLADLVRERAIRKP